VSKRERRRIAKRLFEEPFPNKNLAKKLVFILKNSCSDPRVLAIQEA